MWGSWRCTFNDTLLLTVGGTLLLAMHINAPMSLLLTLCNCKFSPRYIKTKNKWKSKRLASIQKIHFSITSKIVIISFWCQYPFFLLFLPLWQMIDHLLFSTLFAAPVALLLYRWAKHLLLLWQLCPNSSLRPEYLEQLKERIKIIFYCIYHHQFNSCA